MWNRVRRIAIDVLNTCELLAVSAVILAWVVMDRLPGWLRAGWQRVQPTREGMVGLVAGIALGTILAPVAAAAVAVQGTPSLAQVVQVFDNLTQTYVTLTCAGPVAPPRYLRQTVLPGTDAPLMLKLGQTGIAKQLPKLDGASFFADPGGFGKMTVMVGDDDACTVNPQELTTQVLSSMGSTFGGVTDESIVGKFMCIRFTPDAKSTAGDPNVKGVMKINGSATWHTEPR